MFIKVGSNTISDRLERSARRSEVGYVERHRQRFSFFLVIADLVCLIDLTNMWCKNGAKHLSQVRLVIK